MEAQPSNKAHRIITTIFFLIIHLAHHSATKEILSFPHSQGGTQGGVKKTYTKKKFLQGNTITHTKTLKQTQLIYFERL